jgi:hypothetical protein
MNYTVAPSNQTIQTHTGIATIAHKASFFSCVPGIPSFTCPFGFKVAQRPRLPEEFLSLPVQVKTLV